MKFLKLTFAVATLAILGTACKKETAQPENKLALQNTTAVIAVDSTEAGVVSNSSTSPTSWTAVGYDLHNNVVASAGNQVNFDSNFNGNITPASGFYLGYYDSPSVTNVTGITLTDVSAVALNVATLGSNTATVVGWYNYDRILRTITPVAKRYAIVGNDSTIAGSTRLYVVQLDGVTTSGTYNTTVNFHTKRLK
ncbi:hypothetical protein [Pedobacter ghigonis]|uniref:hypothetical protein n=1 Tax=Pedobacter ghigonis TaxID=2730403 RepID=UPI001589447B|nr:hypothetical protein [Pedobacter ghigonis]